MLVPPQRVDQAAADQRCLQHFLFPREPRRVEPRPELGRLIRARSSRRLAALRQPSRPAAVQHGHLPRAHRAEHPPEPRRPHRTEPVVQHDPRIPRNPVPPSRLAEGLRRRHHEPQLLRVVREILLQVEEARAGDVPRLVLRPPRLDAVPAPFPRPQEDGALEHPQVLIPQMLPQPFRRHQIRRLDPAHHATPLALANPTPPHHLMPQGRRRSPIPRSRRAIRPSPLERPLRSASTPRHGSPDQSLRTIRCLNP